MKKKILGGIIFVAIMAIATFNINLNLENSKQSLLTLANIEALAQGESGTGCDGHSTWLFRYKLDNVKCPWAVWKTHNKCVKIDKDERDTCCDPDKQTNC